MNEQELLRQVDALSATVQSLQSALEKGEDEKMMLVRALNATAAQPKQVAAAPSQHRDPSAMRPSSRPNTPKFGRSNSFISNTQHQPEKEKTGADFHRNQSEKEGWRYHYKTGGAAGTEEHGNQQYVRRLEAENKRLQTKLEKDQHEVHRNDTERIHQIKTLQGKLAAAETTSAQNKSKANQLQTELNVTNKRLSDALTSLARAPVANTRGLGIRR